MYFALLGSYAKISGKTVHSVRIRLPYYDRPLGSTPIEIKHLINDKRKAFRTWQNDTTNSKKKEQHVKAKSKAQKGIRQLKNEWWVKKAQEIQLLADTNNSRAFFNATKAIYGPTTHGTKPLTFKGWGTAS